MLLLLFQTGLTARAHLTRPPVLPATVTVTTVPPAATPPTTTTLAAATTTTTAAHATTTALLLRLPAATTTEDVAEEEEATVGAEAEGMEVAEEEAMGGTTGVVMEAGVGDMTTGVVEEAEEVEEEGMEEGVMGVERGAGGGGRGCSRDSGVRLGGRRLPRTRSQSQRGNASSLRGMSSLRDSRLTPLSKQS